MKKTIACVLVCAMVLMGLPLMAFGAVIPLGDVNANGQVNAADALKVLRYAVGKDILTEGELSACDVNYSDSVNATDALHILRYSVGKIQAFTPELTGRVITIASVYPHHLEQGTPYGSALWQGIRTAVARYNVDEVLLDTISLSELEEKIFYYDLVEMPSENARALAKKGLVRNLAQKGAINWEDANSGSTLSCTMGDMVCGVASPAMSTVPLGIAMNTKMLKWYAPQSYDKLQQQWNDGTWDFNALTALCEEFRKYNNGPVMISNTNIIGQAVMANTGYEVKFKEDGSGAVCSLATPEGITALSYVKELKTKGYFKYESNIPTMMNEFAQGKVPLIVYNLAEVGEWCEGYLPLTAMPFPKGPDMDTYTMCAVGSSTFVMPVGDEEYGNSVLALLNCILWANDNLAGGIVAQSQTMGYDDLGQDVFRFATRNTGVDLSTGPFTSAVGSVVDASVLNPSRNPQKELPKIADLIQKEVDAYYGQFYK